MVEFSFATLTWTNWTVGGTIPIARQFAAALISPQEQMFVFGGYSDATQSGLHGVYRLDLPTKTWALGTAMIECDWSGGVQPHWSDL